MVNSPPGEDHWSWPGAHLADGQNPIQMRREGLFWRASSAILRHIFVSYSMYPVSWSSCWWAKPHSNEKRGLFLKEGLLLTFFDNYEWCARAVLIWWDITKAPLQYPCRNTSSAVLRHVYVSFQPACREIWGCVASCWKWVEKGDCHFQETEKS